jgi:hypothetical protein
VTAPGVYGNAGAFAAELTISFILMITVLLVSNRGTLARYASYFVGALYATFTTFETPLSGMSMNPTRTVGSAFHASYWHAIWIYSLRQRWACWSPLRFLSGLAEASVPTAQSCTTPITSAAYFTTEIERHGPGILRFLGDVQMKKWKIDPCTRHRIVLRMVRISAGAACFQSQCPRRVANDSGRFIRANPCVRNVPQCFAPTEGTATIYRIGDGSRVLRFTDFRTSNGPDVHVYMVASEDAKDNSSVQRAGFIDLGSIKENIGDQNYTLGSEVDLSKYQRFLFGADGSVSILELRH